MNRPNLPRPHLKRFARAFWVWLVWSVGASGVQAQGVPPLQSFVTDIVAAPLKPASLSAFEAGSAFTLEGWIYLTRPYPRSWIMGKALPIDGGAGGTRVNYSLQLDDAGTGVRFTTDTYGLFAPGTVPLRTWTHVAATLENGTARLLVNGVVVATRTHAPAIPAAPTLPFGVGAAFDAAGQPAVGEPTHLFARQLRFWSVARSPDQIAAAMGDSIPAVRAGLVAAWPLDESGGTTLRDVSGGGRHLTKGDFIGAMRRSVLEGGPFFSGSFINVPRSLMPDPSSLEVIDFDGDGDLDLIVEQVAQPVFPAIPRRLLAFRNNGGTFVEATDAVLGNVQMDNPYRSWVADFNRDGRLDLFIADTGADIFPVPGAQSRLFIQTADGRLVDESATRLPQRSSYTHDAAVGDVDRDGDLDIYMVNHAAAVHTPRLYVNNGSGFFSDTSDRLPANVATGFTENPGAAFVDLNLDGWPDLVLGGIYYAPNGPNSTRPNLLLMNDRTGRFVSDPNFTLPPKLFGIEGVTPRIFTADFDGNGAPDVLMCTDRGAVDPGLQLLLNDGTGRLRDASTQLNLTFPQSDNWVAGMQIVDLNRDGRPDVVMRTNSATYNHATYARSILLNKGGGVFVDASEALLVNTGFGMRVGDFDRDGMLDLVLLYQERIYVYRGTKLLDLALFADVAPVITTQPASQSVTVGAAVELVATAAGAPLPALQWRKNGVAIPGATNAILALPAASAADAGSYTVVATNAAGTATSAAATLAVSAEVPRLTNVSTRAFAGGGDATLIVGFSIAGSGAKTLLIRGVGPKLGALGVARFVADPALALFSGQAQIDQNNDWDATLAGDFASVGAFALDVGSRDAAMKVTLPPGSYTIHLLNPGALAEALVEVYDLSQDAGTQLSNLSCRLSLAAGETVIVGAVLSGGTRPLLVRNVGPGLRQFGVTPVLEDPRLEIFAGARSVALNNDWDASLEAGFNAVGAFPLARGSRDAAERFVAGPGSYTVHATGPGAGIVLIELYAVP